MQIGRIRTSARTVFSAAAALCLTLLLALSPGAARAQETKPIRIGVSLGLSGPYAELAKLQMRAYQLWEEKVNQNGGILKRPVQVIIHDDHSSPEGAVKLYQQMIEVDKLDFVFSPYSSPLTAAIAPIVEKNDYPMLTPGASADEIWQKGYQNVFGLYSPASRWLIGFFAILAESNLKRIAIISVDDTFSQAVAEGAKRWAPEYGMQIVEYRVMPKAKPDMVAAAKAARDAGAEGLIMAGHYDESLKMRQAMKQIGWMPTVFYASVGPTLQKYHDALGADAQGAFSTSTWEPRSDLRIPGSAEFLKNFQARYKEVPSYHSAAAFAAGQVLEQAILKAKNTDRSAVRRAMATLDVNTVIGRYAVDRSGLQAKRFPLIVQWQGAKREIIWPPELQTAKPLINK